MNENLNTYRYTGYVTSFGKIIDTIQNQYTKAVTEARAKANLAFTYKMTHSLTRNTKIELPGKLEVIQ